MNDGGWIAVSTLAVAAGGLAVAVWVAWHQRAQGKLISAELDDRHRAIHRAKANLRTVVGKAQNRLKNGQPTHQNLRTECAELAGEIERLSAMIPGAETLGYSTAEKVRLAVRSQDAARDALPLLKELADQVGERG